MLTKDEIEVRITAMHIDPGYMGFLEGKIDSDYIIDRQIEYMIQTGKVGEKSLVVIRPEEKSNILHTYFSFEVSNNKFLPPYRCLYTIRSDKVRDTDLEDYSCVWILVYGNLVDGKFIIADGKSIESIVSDLDWDSVASFMCV